jgi:predicted RNA binding protein YcfA (HicA-like mRNA interferase family)
LNGVAAAPAIVYVYTILDGRVTAREAKNRLLREGWEMRAGKGSHLVFKKDGRRVVVSNHAGDIPSGTMRAICAQAGWEFPPHR